MKSQKIYIRNLPADRAVTHTVRLKPLLLIFLILLSGILLFFASIYYRTIAAVMVMVALFMLAVMPEKILCEFTDKYLILYNQKDHSRCMMIYWEDIVNWRYEWHAYSDQLWITLVDGISESIELYSKRSVRRWLNRYAPQKELRHRK